MNPRDKALHDAFDILTAYLVDECPDDCAWEDFDADVDDLRSKIDGVIHATL